MWGGDIYMPYLCAHQKAQREPDPDLHSQFALHARSQLRSPDCQGRGKGRGRVERRGKSREGLPSATDISTSP